MPYRHFARALAAAALIAAGCGSGGGADSPEIIERRVNDLMENVGLAVVYQNWHMLASMGGAENAADGPALAEQFSAALAAAGTLTHVVDTQRGELNEASVTVGNGPDPEADGFRGIRIEALVGEESGHYAVLALTDVRALE